MANVLITTDTRYPVNRKIIRKAVADGLSEHRIGDISAEISVAVVGIRKMKDLCQKYLGDEGDHQILTFALEEVIGEDGRGFVNIPDGILRLGDVILCWPKVLVEAASDDALLDDKVYELMLHGVGHLLGEHHE